MKAFLKSNRIDLLVLSAFVVFITFQPYYLYGKINLFEVGLYLPGINAVLHGLVPYRDFFHLRGPFELYLPAGMMALFGTQLSVLSLYFYIGTVLTLIVCVFLGKELYPSRVILYVMVPVLVGRTFPRVVFSYWGGVRYAFGILALFFVVKFFKKEKSIWIFLAGIASSLGMYTSIEIGVCAVAGIFTSLIFANVFRMQNKKVTFKSFLVYFLGMAAIGVPYSFYQLATHSFFPFLESVFYVVATKESIIDTLLVSQVPRNTIEFIQAVLIPTAKNFRQFTPIYFYVILAAYFIFKIRRKQLSKIDCGVVAIAAYGLIMYKAAFRNIWAAQFEMALQPEKILLFYVLGEIYAFLKKEKNISMARKFEKIFRTPAHSTFLTVVIISSVFFSIARFNHRYFSFQYVTSIFTGKNVKSLVPLAKEDVRTLHIARGQGMVVPANQADELEAIVDFFDKNTAPDEVVWTYPELGIYNFFIDRPFLGRFPIPTFAWFNDRWHEEFMRDLKASPPKYLVLQNEFPPRWKEVYLGREENRSKYKDVMDFIAAQYFLKTNTPQSFIYVKKGAK